MSNFQRVDRQKAYGTPIAISKSINLNFGNVAMSATAGTVVLIPEGSCSLTGTLNVSSSQIESF